MARRSEHVFGHVKVMHGMVKNFTIRLTGVTLVLLLAACSSNPNAGKQISGNEDYLQTPALTSLASPKGVILPVQHGDYEIPSISGTGQTGKALDIRPPTQPMPVASDIDKMQGSADSASAEGALVVQSGSDNTGLPVVIVRTSYSTLWDRLPAALQEIGMEINDSSKAQGSMEVEYSDPGKQVWSALNVTAPMLDEGKYKVQLGDLDNRSSLQFINSRGQVLTLSQNDSMLKVLEAALNKPKSAKK